MSHLKNCSVIGILPYLKTKLNAKVYSLFGGIGIISLPRDIVQEESTITLAGHILQGEIKIVFNSEVIDVGFGSFVRVEA